MSATASVRLSWAWWGLLGGALALASSSPARLLSCIALSITLLVLALRQFLVVLPQQVVTTYTQLWGTVATFGSVVCWLACISWGVLGVLRYAPDVSRWIPRVLGGALTATWLLVACRLQVWRHSDVHSLAGLFPSQTIWSSWCAISMPVLWDFRTGWWIAALAGLWLGHSASSWVAVAIGTAWQYRMRDPVKWLGLLILLAGMTRWQIGPFWWERIRQRWWTWQAALAAIFHHPIGIGFSPFAYGNSVSSTHPLLPHPASDVLLAILTAGWIALPLLAWLIWSTHRFGGWWMKIAFVLSLIQTSVSLPQVGFLVMVLWAVGKVSEYDRRLLNQSVGTATRNVA